MEFRMTKKQVARGTRADAETHNQLHVLKSASELRATYQIRLLLYRAQRENKKLILNVKQGCTFHDDLKALLRDYRHLFEIVRR